METRVLITPRGRVFLQETPKYSHNDILDIDENTINSFAQIFNLEVTFKRSAVLYTLYLNKLLYNDKINFDNYQPIIDRDLFTVSSELSLLGISAEKRSQLYNFTKFVNGTWPHSTISQSEWDNFKKSFYYNIFSLLPKINNPSEIRGRIVSKYPPNATITTQLIESIFNDIDNEYFKGQVSDWLFVARKSIIFNLSDRMTKTAGKLGTIINGFEMTISTSIFNNDISDQCTSGIKCSSNIEALEVTIEHELAHLIDHMEEDVTGIPIVSSHGARFKYYVTSFFGHMKITHDLIGGKFDSEDVESQIRKHMETLQLSKETRVTLSVGQRVYITDKSGKKLYGTVTKLNPKRGVIKLDDGRSVLAHYPLIHMV